MEADWAERHPKVYGAREEGESMANRGRHLKVCAFVTVPVSPGAELAAASRVQGEPVDVVGRGAPRDPDHMIIAQVQRLPLHLVL